MCMLCYKCWYIAYIHSHTFQVYIVKLISYGNKRDRETVTTNGD